MLVIKRRPGERVRLVKDGVDLGYIVFDGNEGRSGMIGFELDRSIRIMREEPYTTPKHEEAKPLA